MKKKSPIILPLFVALIYTFLYLPMLVLIIFSFNKSAHPFLWEGFSFHWYSELFNSAEVWGALRNSLLIATVSVLLSLTLGMLFIFYSAKTFLQRLVSVFYGTLIAPEIVLAIGLLSIFSFFNVPLGITSLIAGHTLIGLGYVIPMLYTRYQELDYRLTEASLDLGATQTQTFFRIILPLLFPSLLASALLVFILSIDDFLISYFCAGAATLTLPLYIFNIIRAQSTPLINALSVLLLCVSGLGVLLFSALTANKREL